MTSSKSIREKSPKVSVSLITYNHASYIAQAIESVLNQKTNFDYELIIGEDDSTDGTREIVLSYREKYPDKIKVLLNKRENVIHINGKPTGRWNFINNLKHCHGEYIALLEGDDYWTHPEKLQRQADYLDINPNHSLCFHKVIFLSEDNQFDPTANSPYQKRRSYSLEDLIQKNFIPTLSVLYRNIDVFSNLPEWFSAAPVADYFLHLLAAEQGRIGYLDDQMGVRRVHGSGYWSAMSLDKRMETNLKINQMVYKYFQDSAYERVAESSLYYARYRHDYVRKKYFSSTMNLVKCLKLVPEHISVRDRGLIKSILDIFVPPRILGRIGRFTRLLKEKLQV